MNGQKNFNPEELKENTERKRKLIELVASKEAALIVGAGSSARLGYPSWPDLLEEMEKLARECGEGFKRDCKKRKDEPLEYAEDIKLHIIEQEDNLNKYYNLVSRLFSAKIPPCDDLHKMLVSLPFRGILTTNYDKVLEAALGKKNPSHAYDNSLVIDSNSAARVHEFLRALTDSSLTRRIAHLHGKYETPDSIILSIKDYEKAYGLKLTENQEQKDSEWTLHRKLLWAVLATRRVVFIGFSMNDPYLNKMLETVSTDLWEWGRSTHFVIMSISPKNSDNRTIGAKTLKDKYGVDTVFYEVFDNSHRGLDRIVYEIAKECSIEIPSTIMTQYPSDDHDPSEEEEPTPVESESQDGLVWAKQVNERMEKGISDDEN